MLQQAISVIGQWGQMLAPDWFNDATSQQVEDGEKCSSHLSFVTSTHHMSESHTSYPGQEMTHSQSQKTISFSSSSCGQLWMSWGFPHMELKKHHHHHIICFSHLGIQNRHLVPITEFVLCHMSWNGLRYSDKLKAFHPERSKKGDISSRLWLLCMWCLSVPNG